MSLVITKGYLIARYDYNLFDEILVFINNYGNKFTCIALGTRKITSKNARSLLYGNYLEIEMFYSNSDRLSKLKKIVSLNQIGFEYSSNLGLLIASDILAINKKTSKKMFDFYQTIIAKVLSNYNEYKISIYVFLFFIKNVIKISSLKKCNHYPNNIKIGFNFESGSFVCTKCYNNIESLSIDEFNLMKEFLIKNIDIDIFLNKTYNINWVSFYKKLYFSFKKLVKKVNLSYRQKENNNEKH